MPDNRIYYKAGYKYQLVEDYSMWTEIWGHSIHTEYIYLDATGLLTICHGYAWDGPSGPAIDTRNFMRGSLVHDALYQLMREGCLPESYRPYADKLLQEICNADGMSKIRAWWVWRSVKRFAGPCASPKNIKPVMEAGGCKV